MTGERLKVKGAEYSLLGKIYRRIKDRDTPHLTEDYLSTIGVSASQVDYLPSDGIDPIFKPAYFEPIPHEKLEALLANPPDLDPPDHHNFPTFGNPHDFDDAHIRTHRLNSYFIDRISQIIDERAVQLFDKSVWAKVYWPGDTHYVRLNDYNGIHDWQVTRLFDMTSPAKPHMLFVMTNMINAKEDCLLQGELKAMIQVMHGRVPYSFFREHLVFPIFIISYTGVQHARLIQGHNQDGKLHVQYTKLYDLRTEQTDFINLILRYFMSRPVGDTTLDHIKG